MVAIVVCILAALFVAGLVAILRTEPAGTDAQGGAQGGAAAGGHAAATNATTTSTLAGQ